METFSARDGEAQAQSERLTFHFSSTATKRNNCCLPSQMDQWSDFYWRKFWDTVTLNIKPFLRKITSKLQHFLDDRAHLFIIIIITKFIKVLLSEEDPHQDLSTFACMRKFFRTICKMSNFLQWKMFAHTFENIQAIRRNTVQYDERSDKTKKLCHSFYCAAFHILTMLSFAENAHTWYVAEHMTHCPIFFSF